MMFGSCCYCYLLFVGTLFAFFRWCLAMVVAASVCLLVHFLRDLDVVWQLLLLLLLVCW